MNPTPNVFEPDILAAWTQLASQDTFVSRHSILADLRLGLRNTDTNEGLWLAVSESNVQGGSGLEDVAFYLEGTQSAFDDLARGLPFNRLVRQHRLTVRGDLRCCVQNWLLLYALTRLIVHVEL